MLSLSTILKYYKRDDIQNTIIESSRNREVVPRYGEGFGKRPDMLKYPKDIIELARQGATSFHVSEERWKNPLLLNPNLHKNELDSLRVGWDLVLDIDCHLLEYSRIAAELVIGALHHNGIKSISCKFSGNKGFHIGVPYEAFPQRVNNLDASMLFPEGARRIGLYIKDVIKEPLTLRILELEKADFSLIARKTNKSVKEITVVRTNKWGDKTSHLNTESFLDIDTLLISSRHLYRSVYSLHEKSGLASIPLKLKEVGTFSTSMAKPESVVVSQTFLDATKAEAGEAKSLFTQAFDHSPVLTEQPKEGMRTYADPEDKINEMYFPPCMQNILLGLEDGRKRAVFILLNFLTKCGWKYDDIRELLLSWNTKNKEPLREQNIVGPSRYHQEHKKKILPPNCSTTYYKDIGVCKPDNLCAKIKNPVNYTRRKLKYKE